MESFEGFRKSGTFTVAPGVEVQGVERDLPDLPGWISRNPLAGQGCVRTSAGVPASSHRQGPIVADECEGMA